VLRYPIVVWMRSLFPFPPLFHLYGIADITNVSPFPCTTQEQKKKRRKNKRRIRKSYKNLK